MPLEIRKGETCSNGPVSFWQKEAIALSKSGLVAFLEGKRLQYRPEAYAFVLHSLRYTQANRDEPGHVSGQALCSKIAEFGRMVYGPLVLEVLHHWGVKETMDFGRIVYDLIDFGQMRKSEEDSITDFQDVYDFEDEFGTRYDWTREFIANVFED